jgi:hypothetical protein
MRPTGGLTAAAEAFNIYGTKPGQEWTLVVLLSGGVRRSAGEEEGSQVRRIAGQKDMSGESVWGELGGGEGGV